MIRRCIQSATVTVFLGFMALTAQVKNTIPDYVVNCGLDPEIISEPVTYLGHYVDYTSGYTSECNEFVAVYDAELDSFLSFCDPLPYYYSNSSEYFAEAYRQCILFPDEMSKYCPLTYLYITLCSDSL